MNNDKALKLFSSPKTDFLLFTVYSRSYRKSCSRYTITVRHVLLLDFVMMANILFSFSKSLSENDSEDIECIGV